MNILFIAGTDPRSRENGNEQRTHLLWKSLCEKGTVYTTILCSEGVVESREIADKIAEVGMFASGWKGRLQSLLYAHWYKPSVWWFNFSFNKKIPWKGIKFDVVVCRYLQSVVFSRAWTIAPCFVDVDDLPTEAYETLWSKMYNPLWRPIARKVVGLWQRRFLRRCKGAWIANENQQHVIENEIPCLYLPNRAMLPKENYKELGNQKNQLMTVGLMDYAPNFQGVSWFVENVWPLVHERHPDVRYVICGRKMRNCDIKAWSKIPGVDVLGAVDDLDRVYSESIAVVAPILSGSGTCIKVIESALHGRISFVTPFAARGINAEDQKKLGFIDLTTNNLIDWLEKRDQDSQESISNYARAYNSTEKFSLCVYKLIDNYR